MGTTSAKQLIEACHRGEISCEALREELCRRVESGQLDVPGVGQMSTAGAVEAFIESSQRAARARQGSGFRGLLDFVSEVSSGISQGFTRWLEGPKSEAPAENTTTTMAPTSEAAVPTNSSPVTDDTDPPKSTLEPHDESAESTQVLDIAEQLIDLTDIAKVEAPELEATAGVVESEPTKVAPEQPAEMTQLELLTAHETGQLGENEFLQHLHARIDAHPSGRDFKPYELRAIGLPPDYTRQRLSCIDAVELLRARKARRSQIQREVAAGHTGRAEEARRAAIRRYQRGSCDLAGLEACLEVWGSELRPLSSAELETATKNRRAQARRRAALVDFRRLLTHYECETVRRVADAGDSSGLADQLIGQLSCSHIDVDLDEDLHSELIGLWRLLASAGGAENRTASQPAAANDVVLVGSQSSIEERIASHS